MFYEMLFANRRYGQQRLAVVVVVFHTRKDNTDSRDLQMSRNAPHFIVRNKKEGKPDTLTRIYMYIETNVAYPFGAIVGSHSVDEL